MKKALVNHLPDPPQIADFWQRHPCGAETVVASDWRTYFVQYDQSKWTHEPHILEALSQVDFRGKRVLEIGTGQGAEAQQLIQRGARYNGIDLTSESIERVRRRCDLFGLELESLAVMNAERLLFPDDSFDMVFSHGVIHHSPRIQLIVREIGRVLRPGGTALVMVYHRNSVNYQLSIKVIRRVGIFSLFVPGVISIVAKVTGEQPARVETYRDSLKAEGLSYLRMDRFIHKATDGPDNVFSSVFSRREAAELFNEFRQVSFRTYLLNERHFPIVKHLLTKSFKRRLVSRYGWHLWITAIK